MKRETMDDFEFFVGQVRQSGRAADPVSNSIIAALLLIADRLQKAEHHVVPENSFGDEGTYARVLE